MIVIGTPLLCSGTAEKKLSCNKSCPLSSFRCRGRREEIRDCQSEEFFATPSRTVAGSNQDRRVSCSSAQSRRSIRRGLQARPSKRISKHANKQGNKHANKQVNNRATVQAYKQARQSSPRSGDQVGPRSNWKEGVLQGGWPLTVNDLVVVAKPRNRDRVRGSAVSAAREIFVSPTQRHLSSAKDEDIITRREMRRMPHLSTVKRPLVCRIPSSTVRHEGTLSPALAPSPFFLSLCHLLSPSRDTPRPPCNTQ